MRNKELFVRKLDHVMGKIQTIRVMSTRQGTTVQDLDKILDSIYEELGDLNTMLEREGKDAYNR